MNTEEHKDMTIRNDKNIDIMATALTNLAVTVEGTNEKLEKTLVLLSSVALLAEKYKFMDENLRESFGRVHNRMDDIEEVQDTHDREGCRALQVEHQKVKDLARSIDDVRDDLKLVKVAQGGMMSGASIRWFAGLTLTYMVLFGTYVVQVQNQTTDTQNTHIAKCAIVKEHFKEDLKDLKDDVDDWYDE